MPQFFLRRSLRVPRGVSVQRISREVSQAVAAQKPGHGVPLSTLPPALQQRLAQGPVRREDPDYDRCRALAPDLFPQAHP